MKTVVPPLNTHFGTNTQVINSPNDQIHRTVSDATCTPVHTSTSRMNPGPLHLLTITKVMSIHIDQNLPLWLQNPDYLNYYKFLR